MGRGIHSFADGGNEIVMASSSSLPPLWLLRGFLIPPLCLVRKQRRGAREAHEIFFVF